MVAWKSIWPCQFHGRKSGLAAHLALNSQLKWLCQSKSQFSVLIVRTFHLNVSKGVL